MIAAARHRMTAALTTLPGRLTMALLAACAAAVPAAMLAVVVQRPGWPVARLDHAVADGFNEFAAGKPWWVHLMDAISAVGHPITFRVGATVVALWLVAAGRNRLALWAFVTTWGGALLGVVLKSVVARARPVVPAPVSIADGYSFPSGHALGAVVGCGVLLLLVFALAPPLSDRARRLAWVVALGVAALVGLSRIALGVHFLSDVAGAWLVGIGWLVATSLAFEAWRVGAGLPVTDPAEEGLEPEARAHPDDTPDPVFPSVADRPLPPWWVSGVEIGRHIQVVFLPWLLVVGLTIGVGWLVAHVFAHDAIGAADRSLARWFVEQRNPAGNGISRLGSLLGETGLVVVLTVSVYVVGRTINRSWHESTALMFAVVGEVWGFLLIALAVDRPRPPVPHLDVAPPTDSFPSGHTAASVCCYGMLAILLHRQWVRTRAERGQEAGRWSAVAFGTGAAALVLAVGVSRLYRGMHHLTDVLGGVLYGGVWLTVVVVLVLRRHCAPPPAEPPLPAPLARRWHARTRRNPARTVDPVGPRAAGRTGN